jgi:predicted RNA-binding protein with EMAP domain
MREEVLLQLRSLIQKKIAGSWKDGWVYGKLKQEFDLQPDELAEMARLLGFKKGWNSVVESLLEEQWQKEKHAEEALKRARKSEAKRELAAAQVLDIESKNLKRGRFSDVEMALVKLILKMNSYEQSRLLQELSKRYADPFNFS